MKSIPLRFFAGLALLLTVTKANAAEEYSLRDGTLWNGSRPVLQNVPSGFAIVADPTGAGVFLRMTVPEAGSLIQSPPGAIAGLQRFTSCHRDEPWWMVPAAGRAHSDVKLETQWLLAEKPPRVVETEGKPVAFQHDAASGRLSATLPAAGKQTVVLRW